MRGNESVSVSRMRLLKAVTVILAILLVVPGIDAVVRFALPVRVANAVDVGLDAASLMGTGDPSAALDRIEAAAAAEEAEVPSWFSGEVGFLPGARDVRASGGSVVGYLVSGDCGTVLGRLTEYMRSAGWTAVPLGGVDGATYVKSSGSCAWVLVTCTQVGEDTSVVVRSVVE